MSEKVVITREQVKEFTRQACEKNHMSEEFFDGFWSRLLQHDEIYKEYVYYLIKQDFKNEYEVEGYHAIDVLIWQMDHFKARLDEDTTETKKNEATMIMKCFDTFLKMAENPEEYVTRMQNDTGTELPNKFFNRHK